MSKSITEKQQKSKLFKLLFGASGIYISYVLLGIFSEKIYSIEYESNIQFDQQGKALKHYFTYPTLYVIFSSFLCSMYGFIKSKIYKEEKSPIIIREQVILGFLFALTLLTTVFSLLYVSYLTHVVACNCRYLFVVIIGTFFSRVQKKSHLKLPTHKLVIALILTSGIFLFNIVNHHDSADHHNPKTQWKGYILIVVSVIASGLFSDSQAYIKSSCKPTANHLFFAANFYSFLICLGFSFIQGSFVPSLEFIFSHQRLLFDLILMGFLQVFGQISIYYVISNFKQHIFPLISTSRKVVTVFLSILIFNHDLVFWQWIGLGIVLIGMIIEVKEQISQANKKEQLNNKKE